MENLSKLVGLKGLSRPVLVTGHTGFKGMWLTLLLQKIGVEVIGYSLDAERDSLYSRLKKTDAISAKIGNIEDFDSLDRFFALHKPSLVMHLAAQPLVNKSYEFPIETFRTNVMGTANVLEASRRHEVQVVGVVTTDKVYSNDNSGLKFKEENPLFGHDPYSASKVATESVASAWSSISRHTGGPKITTLRAGNVIGGGDFAENRLLPDIVRSIFFEEKLAIRGKSSTRPWQHVLDPLFGYLLAVESALHSDNISNNFNFGPSESSLSVREVLESVEELGYLLKYDEIAVDERYEAKNLDLDSGKSCRELNWKPLWTQEEAIKSTITWWNDIVKQGLSPQEVCINEIVHLLNGIKA